MDCAAGSPPCGRRLRYWVAIGADAGAGLTLANSVPVESRGADLSGYWRRCVYSAAAARALAARFLPGSVEDCFIAALLMDLGTLVLDRALGERYEQVSRQARTHAELAVLETAALDANHAEVGAMLVRHWGLPAVLEIPVGAHHGPQTVENPKLRAVAEVLELSGAAPRFSSATAGRRNCRRPRGIGRPSQRGIGRGGQAAGAGWAKSDGVGAAAGRRARRGRLRRLVGKSHAAPA